MSPVQSREIFTVAAMGTAAVLVFSLLPLIATAMASRFGLDDVQIGLAAAAYFGCYAVVTGSSVFWVQRFSHQWLALSGFVLMATGLVTSLSAETFPQAQVGLGIAGTGAGLLFPISFTIASRLDRVERVYAIKLAAEQLIPAAMLFLVTTGVILVGVYEDLFLVATMVVVIGCSCVFLVGKNSNAQESETYLLSNKPLWAGLALSGLAVNFAGFAGVWAFVELLANESQLDRSFSGRWIAIGLVMSGLGPLTVAFIAGRVERGRAIKLAILVSIASLVLLNGDLTELRFAACLVLLPFAFYFSVSYIMTVIADVDYNGRVSALMSFVLAIGALAGPAVFGILRASEGPILTVMGAFMVFGAWLVIVAEKFSARSASPGP